MRRSQFMILTILFFCLSLPFAGRAQAVDEPKSAGVQAFEAGDYERAREHFLAAVRESADPRLVFNLGVVSYKLADYDAARRWFLELVDEPEWADLARFNLGLVARRQHRLDEAAEWFRRVRHDAANEKLLHLADKRLRDIEAARAPAASRNEWHGIVDFSVGRDDNVIAFPDQLQQDASQGRDEFAELLGYGQRTVAGSPGNGVLLHGFAFSRNYSELEDFNSRAFGAGALLERAHGEWRLGYGADLMQTRVSGMELVTAARLDLRARREVGRNRYELYYRPAVFNAGSAYPQLEGSAQRLGAKWRHARNGWRFKAGYRFELHDRDDLENGETFFSYSPLRHRVDISVDWLASRAWSFTVGVRMEAARYDGENRLRDTGGSLVVARREADTVQGWLRGEYSPSANWRAHLEWRSTETDDTFELYSYERNLLALGLEYVF